MPSALPAWLLPLSGQAPKPRGSSHTRAAAPSDTHTNTPPATHPTKRKSSMPSTKHQLHSSAVVSPQTTPASLQHAYTNLPLPASGEQSASHVDLSAGHASGFLKGRKSSVQTQRKHASGLGPGQLTGVATKRQLKLQAPLGITHRARKRVQLFGVVKASQRCGHCKTCQNRSMKKACLTRRMEMEAVVAATPVNVTRPLISSIADDPMKA